MNCYLILLPTGFYSIRSVFRSVTFPACRFNCRSNATKFPFEYAAKCVAKRNKLKNYEIVEEDY